MSIFESIKNRVSIPFLQEKEIPENEVRALLDAAVCTPVHYKANPWRFLVIRGEGRQRFGDFMAERAAKAMSDPDSSDNQAKLAKLRTKPLRAPVIIVAGAAKPELAKVVMKENVAAVAAACQNILICAQEKGLGAIWRTGGLTYDPDTVDYLGFDEGTELVGFIYLGYPEKACPPKKRENASGYTRWMD